MCHLLCITLLYMNIKSFTGTSRFSPSLPFTAKSSRLSCHQETQDRWKTLQWRGWRRGSTRSTESSGKMCQTLILQQQNLKQFPCLHYKCEETFKFNLHFIYHMCISRPCLEKKQHSLKTHKISKRKRTIRLCNPVHIIMSLWITFILLKYFRL